MEANHGENHRKKNFFFTIWRRRGSPRVEQLGGMTNQKLFGQKQLISSISLNFRKRDRKAHPIVKMKNTILNCWKDLNLDVKLSFDIESGIKVNEYIDSATTTIPLRLKPNLKKVHFQFYRPFMHQVRTKKFAPFKEIKNTSPWLMENIPLRQLWSCEKKREIFLLEKIGWFECWQKVLSYRFGSENFIESPQRSFVFDWLRI